MTSLIGRLSSGELIYVAAFLSPTGNPFPTTEVMIYMDRLHNSTTNLDNYAHFVAFADYENRPSYFHAFKLFELNNPCRETRIHINWYVSRSFSRLAKTNVNWTVIGDKAYSVQYIVDASRYSDYLPTVQRMIQSLVIK
jgi:hypothetical protein